MAKPKLLTGLLIAVLLTLPLIALLYLASVLLMVPFPPFDVFDFVSRNLPGKILTFGIDLMVDTIRALNIGRTDTTAKLAEQTMAYLNFAGLAIVSGVIYLEVVKRQLKDVKTLFRDSLLSGLIFGLAFGIPVILIFLDLNSSATAEQSVSVLWLLFAFSVWGIGHGYIYSSLVAPKMPENADNSVTVLNRRQFLVQMGASTATITVFGAGLGALINSRLTDEAASSAEGISVSQNAEDLLASFPNADDAVQPAPGTRPEYTPLDDHYRIDISSGKPPQIDAVEYTLPLSGLIENPTELTLDQIRNDFESTSRFITMSCISNRLGGDLIGTTLWTGTSMQNLLDLVKPTAEATHIKITGADGFDEFVAIEDIRSDETVMLCYAWDNQPLQVKHGFPLRIHVPNHFGMKQPKWITGMEFVGAWEEGYWVRRGWSKDAIAVATSVIDTVASDMMIIDSETEEMRVPIGGIAWANVRGISKVEVRVDEGEWEEAQLRTPLSDRAWVIWRYDWLFAEGEHNFEVRCYEGDGTMQIETSRGVRPDGATGISSMDVNL